VLFKNDRIGGAEGMVTYFFGVQPPDWISYGIVPIVICLALHYYAFAFLLMSGALMTVDSELEEAGAVAGMARWQRMVRITMPEKESYPVKKSGNIPVHCRGGRSRSVAVSALCLHLKYPGRWPTFDEALQYVREKRQIKPEDYHEAPKEDLLVLVRQVLKLRDSGAVVLP
jgi:hypothetical protein